jgi:hypothetical protein
MRIDDPGGIRPGGYHQYLDEKGDVRVELSEPVCDFCLAPRPTWEYPAARMPILGHPVITDSDDEWLACDACHALIEARNIAELVEFSLAGQVKHVPPGAIKAGGMAIYPPMPIRRRTQRENLRRFLDARCGPARPFAP